MLDLDSFINLYSNQDKFLLPKTNKKTAKYMLRYSDLCPNITPNSGLSLESLTPKPSPPKLLKI